MASPSDLFDLYASLRRAVARRANGVFKEINLGTRQFIILFSLHQNKKMTVGDLVVASMTDASTVSRALAQLEKNGLLEKAQCPHDGRRWYVRLTAKGRALAPEMERLYSELATECFAGLGAAEREQLGLLLSKVVSRIDAQAASRREEAEV